MRLLRAHSTSRLVSLAPAALDCLEHGEPPGEGFITAGTSRDGSLAWLCRGPSLEVFSTVSGTRVSAWTFGAALHDQDTCITATAELNYEGALQLLVATRTSSNTTGLLCVLDLQRSIITKAIELPYKVTAVECVSGAGAGQTLGGLVGERLQSFCGIVAMGTAMGHVYVIDLCLDNEEDSSDEIRPNSVLFLDDRSHNVPTLRFNAMAKRKHLCLELDEESNKRGYFYFRKADFSIIKTFAADDVFVSNLSFIKQTGSLAVGFNFGCFQLWKLSDLTLEYSSRMEDDLAPVLNFAYQEPENDPRSFCYLWVARGPLPQDSIEDYCSHLQLFQLGYNRKLWQDGAGYVYYELTSVCGRFEHELTSNPYIGSSAEGLGSRLVTCYTLRDPSYRPPERAEDDSDIFDEGCVGEDLSLCVFVWEASSEDAHAKPAHFLAVFDMNRWYQAQMPFSIRLAGGSQELCPYFAFSSLEESAEALSPDNLMTVCIDYRSVSRFQSCILPPPEQHYYPSSLAFDVCCIGEGGLVHSKFLGAQRQLLADLQQRGPDALVENSSDMYHLCLHAGLLPRNMDIASINLPAVQKREALLSAALENDMLQFIISCMSQWARGGDTDSGCSLRFMLEWAWSKVGHIKSAIDKLCESLYDWSGSMLDTQATQLLRHYQTMLAHLDAIFQAMGSQALPSTEQGRADLSLKQQVVRLIGEHLNAVLWFYTVGLLPEHPEADSVSDGQYAYPAAALAQAYAKRRQEIKSLHSELQGTDLLLIDGMVEHMGAPVPLLFERHSGSGLYPPSSFHTLLLLYLAEGVPTATKQLVVAYLLFDLMHLAPEDQTTIFSSRLKAFSQAFGLTHSQTRLIQGMWLLDHKDFEDSLLFLLDPMVRSELAPWQNTRIIKAFVYQGSPKLALKFYRIRKPPAVTPEDVKLKLTVLLANGLTSEAFEYQQLSRDQLSAEDLLSHLFLGCQQTKMVDALLQLPLSDEEEKHLVEYLKTTHESGATELLVLYYLQRSRFIEAIRLNSRLKHSSLNDLDPGARDRAATRNAIVDCYHAVLPRVQRRLALETEMAPKKSHLARREVARPVPLSAVIQRSHRAAAMSHASLIQAVLGNVRDVKTASQSPQQHRMENTLAAPGPFICTPITPRSKPRVSRVSEVIFPMEETTVVEHSSIESPRLPPGMSPKKSCLSSPFSSTAVDFVVSSVAKKRMSRFFGAEALSLLQTPPVRHKSPTRSRPPTQPATPQSILKMRHRPESTSSSPIRETPKSSLVSEPRQLTPPRLPRLTDLIAQETGSAPGSPSQDSSFGTPKQLRFNMPTLSPEEPAVIPEAAEEGEGLAEDAETPEEWEDESPLRSVYKRSPTPERMSPKHSAQLDVVEMGSAGEQEEMEMSPETDHLNEVNNATFVMGSDEEDGEPMDTCHEGPTGDQEDEEAVATTLASDSEQEINSEDSASEEEPEIIASEEEPEITASEVDEPDVEEEDLERSHRQIVSRDDAVDYRSSIVVRETVHEVNTVEEVNTVTHRESSFTYTKTRESRTGPLGESSGHVPRSSIGVPMVESESDEEPPMDDDHKLFQRTKNTELDCNKIGGNKLGLSSDSRSKIGLPRVDSDLDRCSTVVNVDSEAANLEDVEQADCIEIYVGTISDEEDNKDGCESHHDTQVAEATEQDSQGVKSGSEVSETSSDDHELFQRTKNTELDCNEMGSYKLGLNSESRSKTGLPHVDSDLDRCSTAVNVDSEAANLEDVEQADCIEIDVGTISDEEDKKDGCESHHDTQVAEATEQDSQGVKSGSEVSETRSDFMGSEVTGSAVVSDHDQAGPSNGSQEVSPSVASERLSLQMDVSDTEDKPETVPLAADSGTSILPLDDLDMPSDADFLNTTNSFLSAYPEPEPGPVRVTRRTSTRLNKSGPGGDLGNLVKDTLLEEEVTSTARRRNTPRKQKQSFKTPPRPSRLTVMPPTPPESGKGSPPKETLSTVEDVPVVPAVQPSTPTRRSARVPSESTQDVAASKPASPTRRSTRASVDDAGSEKPLTATHDKPATPSRRATRGSRQSESEAAPELSQVTRPLTRRASLSRSVSPSKDSAASPGDDVKGTAVSPARRTRRSDVHKLEVPRVTRSRKSASPVADENGADTTPDTTPNVSPAGSPTRTPTRRGRQTPDTATPSRRGKKADASTPHKTPTRRSKKETEPVSPSGDSVGQKRQTPLRKSTRGKTATPIKAPAKTASRQTMDTDESQIVEPLPSPARATRRRQTMDVHDAEAMEPLPSPARTTRRRQTMDTHDAKAMEPLPSPSRATRRQTMDLHDAETMEPLPSPARTTRRRQTMDTHDAKAMEPLPSPARTTRRRQTMDMHDVKAMEKIQETKDRAPSEEGPLSEGSFMMTLRVGGRRSTSRENTPEQLQPAASETGDGFHFAAPDVVDNIEDMKFVDAATDIPSFVFSPPLTRHRKLRQSFSEAPSVPPMPSIIPPLIPEGAATTVPFFIKEKKAKRAKKTSVDSPNSEVLLLPSPPVEDLPTAAENQPTRQKVKRSASMTLRPKRYTSQRKPLKLW